MEKTSYFYSLIETRFGEAGVVFHQDRDRFLVCRIVLPYMERKATANITAKYPGAVMNPLNCGAVCTQIDDFLSGETVAFDFSGLDFGIVSGFARIVLKAVFKIPRGFVMTYGGLAASLGVPGGARAVGNALAGNPFPLVIPCHRVIKGDGSLGGFGGGTKLKRSLLELEQVSFNKKERVLSGHILTEYSEMARIASQRLASPEWTGKDWF